MSMALISEVNAIRLLGDRVYDLCEVMVAAWDDYLHYAPVHRRLHCATTRAGIVHDHIKNRARERFDDDPSCYVGDINKLLVVVIEQRLVIRFKRFLPDKTSRNIPTKQVEDYRMQRDIAGLHEQFNLIGELSNLEAGYILDQFDSEMQETWLVCPSGIRANAWMRQIQNRTATAKVPGASIAPLFPWSPATVQPKEKSIVTIKRSDKEGETS